MIQRERPWKEKEEKKGVESTETRVDLSAAAEMKEGRERSQIRSSTDTMIVEIRPIERGSERGGG